MLTVSKQLSVFLLGFVFFTALITYYVGSFESDYSKGHQVRQARTVGMKLTMTALE